MNRSAGCAACLAGALLAGCASDRAPIPIESAKPLKVELKSAQARLVAGRFLLFPVGTDSESKLGALGSGSFVVIGSAWSGLGKGGSWGGDLVNLVVLDLKDGRTHDVFDRQVAVGSIDDSFDRQDRSLRFANLLLFPARTEDTNADRQIDNRDEVGFYAFDLDRSALRRLSPAGTSVQGWHFLDAEVLLVLCQRARPDALAVYRVDPLSGRGAYVADGIAP